MPLTKADLTRVRDLREKKHREAAGRFVVEGGKVVAELIAEGRVFDEIFATRAWERPVRLPRETTVIEVAEADMARISHFPTPSEVLAIGRIERPDLPAGALRRGLTLALDGVQDPGNVGAMLRIADWFALDRVLLSPDCADLFSQKVINASMGSFARVPVYQAGLGTALVDPGVPVIGCDLGGRDYRAAPPPRDAVIVIGSEGRGLSPAVAARVTERITIPRIGRAESLNAAVAAGIVAAWLKGSEGDKL
ncbi:MAG TPA: RNA methyltransferase [Candidatus Didemnitutus sp.]|nr:RNA methyltransferase [Candidatus Didemnitutus sp.]